MAYEVTTGLDGATFDGEWVLNQRPPDFRFEFIGTVMGEEARTIIIDAGGEFYVCTSAVGQESCLEVDVSEAEMRSAPFSPTALTPTANHGSTSFSSGTRSRWAQL